MVKKFTFSLVYTGAAVADWLSSWLAEQEVRGSIPRLATWISEIGYLPLPSRDMAEMPLKRRKSSIQPTNQHWCIQSRRVSHLLNSIFFQETSGNIYMYLDKENRIYSEIPCIHETRVWSILWMLSDFKVIPGEAGSGTDFFQIWNNTQELLLKYT